MKRSQDQEWRPDQPPYDTAPSWSPDWPKPDEWATSVSEAGALLLRQMCPVCGEGPWKSPLNHVAKKHGIDRHSMRDVCGLSTRNAVVDPDLSDRLSLAHEGRDMSAVTEAGRAHRRPYRMTTAGKRTLTGNLATVTAEQSRENLALARTPEAQARRSATLRDKWAEATPEQRAAWGARVGGHQAHMAAMRQASLEKRGLQPCGTVASYKRGCRCDSCRDAKRASRR